MIKVFWKRPLKGKFSKKISERIHHATTSTQRLGRVPPRRSGYLARRWSRRSGVVAAAVLRQTQRGRVCESASGGRWTGKAVYVNEKVCTGWCRTAAYYTAKLTFSHGFRSKIRGAYYTSVRIIFEFLGYVEKLAGHCNVLSDVSGVSSSGHRVGGKPSSWKFSEIDISAY